MTSNETPLGESRIAALLQTRAERITVHPNLAAVIEPGAETSTGPHRFLAQWVAAAAVLLVVVLGGAALVRDSTNTAVDTNAGSGLSRDLLEFAAPAEPGQQLLVWMHPDATSGHVQAVAVVLTELSEVDEYRYFDHEASYQEFVNHFADKPEIIDLVEPDQLPTFFRVTTTRPPDVADRIEVLPGVEAVEQMS